MPELDAFCVYVNDHDIVGVNELLFKTTNYVRVSILVFILVPLCCHDAHVGVVNWQLVLPFDYKCELQIIVIKT